MIYFSIYIGPVLSVLIALAIACATVRFVATAFKKDPDAKNETPKP